MTEYRTSSKTTVHENLLSFSPSPSPSSSKSVTPPITAPYQQQHQQQYSSTGIRVGPLNPDTIQELKKTREQVERELADRKTKVTKKTPKNPLTNNNTPQQQQQQQKKEKRDTPISKKILDMQKRFKKRPIKHVSTSGPACGDIS